MTVAELIAELQKHPADAGVAYNFDGEWKDVAFVETGAMTPVEGGYTYFNIPEGTATVVQLC